MYQRKIPIEFQEIALTAHAVIALSSFMHQVISLHRITDRINISIQYIFVVCNLPHFLLQDSMWNTSMAMRLGADFLSSRLSVLDKSGTSLDIALVARALQLTRSTTGAETAFEILAKRRKETLGML